MKTLIWILLSLSFVSGTSFAGGGYGTREFLNRKALMTCQGTDIELKYVVDTYEDWDYGGTFEIYLLHVTKSGAEFTFETKTAEDLFTQGDHHLGSQVNSSLSYHHYDSDGSYTLDGAIIESDIALLKGGHFNAWKFDGDASDYKGSSLISLKVDHCKIHSGAGF